jgi:hypothetical protein
MRSAIAITLLAIGVVAGLLVLPGCTGSEPGTAAPTQTSVESADTSSVTASSSDRATTTTTSPTTAATLPAGAMAFEALADRFAGLLETIKRPGTAPLTVLSREEVAPVFGTSMPGYVPDARGYRLANGDTVVLFQIGTPKSWDSAAEAFRTFYGREGQEVTARFYTDFGCLVASRQDCDLLHLMAERTREAPELWQAVAEFTDAKFGPYISEEIKLTAVRSPETKKYGFIDTTGEFVIPAKFAAAEAFSEQVASASLDGKHFGYITPYGTWAIQPRFDDAWSFSEGLGRVTVGGKVGFVDKHGAWVIEPRDWSPFAFSDGLSGVHVYEKGTEKTGYIDQTGAWVIEPRDWQGQGFNDGRAIVEAGGWGVMDKTGAWILEPQPLGVYPYSEDLAVIGRIGDDTFGLYECGYLDTSGHLALPRQFARAQSFSEGLAAASKDGTTWGYIDKSGTFVIQPKFLEASRFSHGLAAVSVVIETDPEAPVRWGYIGQSGDWVIPPQFAHAASFGPGGLAEVSPVEGGRAYIDRAGKIVWTAAGD